ncbi:hypothetical protein J2S43_002567 [Catenuloplanes nepalensis]|uniref:DUF2993 domain-containing protein n=1 Tax=Catenuloplanes nepalensis TaxID=587533 RepID=A0ABT9MRK6_9ACTN|nr:DUF2993 domain-containing protein [Catenuloplanes nepalensis]MDP9794055.1 hypothetical protein [Catenuloplanes nepalensis]
MPGKPLRTVLAVVGVAALAVPVAADRAAVALAENRLAARLSCAAGITGDVDVTIHGFPFLTQLARGTVGDVRLHAQTVTVRDVTLSDVDVRARGLRGTSADTLTASAVLPYAGLPGTAGAAFAGARLGGDSDRLTITTSVPVRGVTMPVTVYADLAVDGNQLTITPGEVELTGLGLRVPASRLPDGLAGARTVPLPALPVGFTYLRISATVGGLRLVVAGTGIDLGPGADQKITNDTCGGTDG